MELKENNPTLTLEVKKEERTYQFIIPVGAPLGECYDAAFAVLNKIVEMAKEAASKAERKEEPEETESNR